MPNRKGYGKAGKRKAASHFSTATTTTKYIQSCDTDSRGKAIGLREPHVHESPNTMVRPRLFRYLELVAMVLMDFEDNTAARLTLVVSGALRCITAAFRDAEDVPG